MNQNILPTNRRTNRPRVLGAAILLILGLMVCLVVVTPGGLVGGIASSDGVMTVQFAGVPGLNYEIQRATKPDGPWSPQASQFAPAKGMFRHTDPNPPTPTAFYRLRQQ